MFAGGPTVAGAQEIVSPRVEPLEIVTAQGSFTFSTEIADTPELRARGLMFRNAMDDDHGMLFDFQVEKPVSMWMKNTFIPLDMLFIGADGIIRNIARWTTPQSLDAVSSRGEVRAVLEVNAGTADRLGIHAGDTVIHPIFAED